MRYEALNIYVVLGAKGDTVKKTKLLALGIALGGCSGCCEDSLVLAVGVDPGVGVLALGGLAAGDAAEELLGDLERCNIAGFVGGVVVGCGVIAADEIGSPGGLDLGAKRDDGLRGGGGPEGDDTGLVDCSR